MTKKLTAAKAHLCDTMAQEQDMRHNGENQELCDSMTHKVPDGAEPARDARIVRTDLSLRQALLTLLERTPLEQITIRQIAAEAGVHYATFFRHHATKEALLDHVAADQIDRLTELTFSLMDRAADGQTTFIAICTYVNDHRALWRALLTGGAAGAMRAELLRTSRQVARDRPLKRKSWIPSDLAVNCTVSLIFETLTWWLTLPSESYSVEEVAQILHRLVLVASDTAIEGR